MQIEVCWACVCGLHAECYDMRMHDDAEESWFSCCCVEDEPINLEERRGVGRPMLNPEDVTDVKSTGRKRAAMVAPIFPGMLCEWSGLKYAGGGVQPIVGCNGTTIVEEKGSGERHHGPDKNVLNNSVGVNLHRICQSCHKRWHALNDQHYSGVRPEADQPYLPTDTEASFAHDPVTQASDEDYELSEAFWGTRTEKRGAYPIALPA